MQTAQFSPTRRALSRVPAPPTAVTQVPDRAGVGDRLVTTVFALTIFLGAFLLFQVQPLIATFILPWFGGGPGVWTTCMLFFQVCLLAGYAYAHGLSQFPSKRTQAVIQIALLLTSLAFLPIVPGVHWKPTAGADPIWRILLLLTTCLGLPYFMLASTGPLLQTWFSRLTSSRSPYRLYALSNLGSLLALISYPVLFEPLLTRRTQAGLWAWSFGLFALLCSWCAWKFSRTESNTESSKKSPQSPAFGATSPTTAMVKAWWFGLPACGSVLLLAITNKLCLDVAAVPFLWMLPLSLYLVTFIICFDRPAWYSRRVFTSLLVPTLAFLCYTLSQGSHVSLGQQIIALSSSLFVGCMICHGEVFRLRPSQQFLTSFYLFIAGGGAAGGIFVGIIAPSVFRSYAELNLGLLLLAGLIVSIHFREKIQVRWQGRQWLLWPLTSAGALALCTTLLLQARHAKEGRTLMARNFYGVLQITTRGAGTPFQARKLNHGSTTHGLQFDDPGLSILATTYYNESSGVGLALNNFPRETNRRVGIVGLGTGTLAVYGKPGDTFRFYEINPEVCRLAQSNFTFLKASKARVEIVPGDARLSLEREPAQQFDLLVLDAFTSDSIPVHLLTQEAFVEYFRHLKPDGALVVHISNVHLNFLPMLVGVAKQFKLMMMRIAWDDNARPWWFSSSDWVILTHNEPFVASQPMLSHATQMPIAYADHPLLWTDDYASLVSIIKY